MGNEFAESVVQNAFEIFIGNKGRGISSIYISDDGTYHYSKHGFRVTGKLDFKSMEGTLIHEDLTYYFTFDENGNVTDDGDAVKFGRYIVLDLKNIDVEFPPMLPVKGIELSVAIPLPDKEEKEDLCFDITLSGIYDIESKLFTVSQESSGELYDLLHNGATGIKGTYFYHRLYHRVVIALVDMLSKKLKERFKEKLSII